MGTNTSKVSADTCAKHKVSKFEQSKPRECVRIFKAEAWNKSRPNQVLDRERTADPPSMTSHSGFLVRSESFCGSRRDETSTWFASSISPAVR